MKGYCIIYFEHSKDGTSMVKVHREYSPLVFIQHKKFDLKINKNLYNSL